MADPAARTTKIRIALATEREREKIYDLRHEVYAREIGQHAENPEKQLRDSLDVDNVYIVAAIGQEIAGFVSVTNSSNGVYSLDA